MSRALGVIGVPTSAGAFAPGQEQAPAALRAAGLIEALHAAGLDVRDHGDRDAWRWRPDRENPQAQNLAKVVEIVRAPLAASPRLSPRTRPRSSLAATARSG